MSSSSEEVFPTYDTMIHARATIYAPDIRLPDAERVIRLKSRCSKHEHLDNSTELPDCDSAIIASTFRAAYESVVLRNMILCSSDEEFGPIPLPITTEILRVIVSFCDLLSRNHDNVTNFVTNPNVSPTVVQWQLDFIHPYEGNYDALERIIIGANFLDVQQLICLAAWEMSKCLRDKTTNEIRAIMHVTDPILTDDEKRQIIQDNSWMNSVPSISPI